MRYSLRGTTDGQTVAVVDEDILSNIDLTQWDKQTKKEVKAAAKEALKKFSNGIVVDGITRSINKVSRNEYTGSKYSEKISKTMPQLCADKMRAASAIDDVVIATTDWAREGKLLHPRTDDFVDFDHGKVLIEAGKNQYSAEVVVGITDRGNAVFYDVVDIQPTQFTTIKEEPSPNVTTNKSPDIAYESSPENRVPQQATGVKENVRYSSRNQTESDNFKQWFSDWQNDPQNASKVVNADGTPKQLYRYTNLEDTVIKPDYRGAIWMADNDWVTSQYGSRYDVLYANMRNPYVFNVDGLDFSEETALVNARKGGHDGLIIHFKFTGENNDYYQFIVENAPNTKAPRKRNSSTMLQNTGMTLCRR